MHARRAQPAMRSGAREMRARGTSQGHLVRDRDRCDHPAVVMARLMATGQQLTGLRVERVFEAVRLAGIEAHSSIGLVVHAPVSHLGLELCLSGLITDQELV